MGLRLVTAKTSLIQSYAMFYNTVIIFIFETVLDSSTEASDTKINIPRHNSLRSDRMSNTKRGDVCMFYKNYLPIIRCALT